jgi:hypothetical protein
MSGGWVSHHEEFEAIGSFLIPCAATGVSLLAVWWLIGAPPRGQPWTPAVTLPHGCDGLSARQMAVLWMFREPSLCRHVRRELLRNALLDFTPIIPATACHQRNYFETYSRYRHLLAPLPHHTASPPLLCSSAASQALHRNFLLK